MSFRRRALLVLGHAWASPITLFGVLVSVGGARFHSLGTSGVLQFAVRGGPVGWWMRRFHISAVTFGATILYARADGPEDRSLVAHERQHVVQTMVLGPLMALAYPGASLIAWLRGGHVYRDNWFERDARRAAYVAMGGPHVVRG